jgi:hypothetical protein
MPKTAGEMASYTFSFTSSIDFESDDYVKIVFPMEFDPFFGGYNDGGMMGANAWFSKESNVYYVSASSTSLGTVWATAKHWEVMISGANTIAAGEPIDVTLLMIANPAAALTSKFSIAHLDSDRETYKSYSREFGDVTPTTLPSFNVEIRSLMVTNRYLRQGTNDYTFEFYLPSTVGVDE